MRHLPALLLLATAACGGPETSFSELNSAMAVAPKDVLIFENTIVDETSIGDLFITNAGQARLDLSEIVLDDPDGVFTLGEVPESISAGDEDNSAVVGISFTPPNFLDYEGSVTIFGNDPENPEQTVLLQGTGVDAPKPDICLSSLAVDFGEVIVGDSAFEFLEIENCGAAPLEIGLVEQSGSGSFILETDPTNATIAAGDSMPVIITYAPTVEEGDNGSLSIASNDPDDPQTIVTLIGNGGGDLPYPEAVVDCPAVTNPPGFFPVDGSDSFDPSEQYPLTYAWSVVSAPSFSTGAQFLDDSAAATEVFLDAAGEYVLQLVVTNQAGIASAPAKCAISGEPADDIHVELTWDGASADLDLHLIENDGEIFLTPGDCTWCNKTADWGVAGNDDDPRLDLDDIGGYGPENINIYHPAVGRYHVKVHYFDDHGDFSVTASVRIWLEGEIKWEGDRVLSRDQVWTVGQINWDEATFAPDPGGLEDAPRRSCRAE